MTWWLVVIGIVGVGIVALRIRSLWPGANSAPVMSTQLVTEEYQLGEVVKVEPYNVDYWRNGDE